LGIHIVSPCSQWLARCQVTRQRYSVAPAPKLWNRKAPSLSSPDAEEILLLLLLLLLYLRFFRPQSLRKSLRFCHLGHLWNMS